MLDGLSLDQIRTFITAADEGSFSAAGRKLHRAQSAVSETISNLELQVGFPLFDRSGRFPKLTPKGRALLAQARVVGDGIDELKARARAMSKGLEAELAVVIDVMFPLTCLSAAAQTFSREYPTIPLRISVDVLGAAFEPVITRACSFGIVGSLPVIPPGLTVERLTSIPMIMVVAASHPLAENSGRISNAKLEKFTQLVTTDRTSLSEGLEFGVVSPCTWRLTDFQTKRKFLLDGLGFGGMPRHLVEEDLAAGRLVGFMLEDDPPSGVHLPLSLIYPADDPPGLAGQRFIVALRDCLGRTT
jgi:DNA-binding transcriptional LysR family regulator